MITDTSSDSCEISIKGLEGGADYEFILAGVAPRDGGSYASIKGYFDTPDIADEVTEGDEEETKESQKPEETAAPAEISGIPETLPATEPENTSLPAGEQTVPPAQSEAAAG